MTREELVENIRRLSSFLCVGLDVDKEKMPRHLLCEPDCLFRFNRAIIDATAPYAVAFKPNLAFYEAYGAEGDNALRRTVSYIHENYPDRLIIADAKRGDIGNTSRMYASSVFDGLGADAVTVAPYMGADSVKPFLGFSDKWVIVLALTSNPGSADFQQIKMADGEPLYVHVIRRAIEWAGDDAERLMFVVGATRADMLADVRRVAPRSFLLVPGIGAQGGSLEEVARYGMTADCGLLVNSSRAIIYASRGNDFAEAAAREAAAQAAAMKRLLKN